MSKKTRKQKKMADARKSVIAVESPKPEISLSARKPVVSKYASAKFQYKETDYDKELKKFTIRDILKTTGIIIALFVVQYVIYLNFGPGR